MTQSPFSPGQRRPSTSLARRGGSSCGTTNAALNDSPYGLQAGVFTRDINKAFKAYENIEAGAVLINEIPTFRADQMPYGGVKDSGNTREGPRYAVREMTEDRLVVIDLPS